MLSATASLEIAVVAMVEQRTRGAFTSSVVHNNGIAQLSHMLKIVISSR